MKYIFLILIIFTSFLNTFGQTEIGIKANGGLSKISNSLTVSNGTWSVRYTPSYQLGAYYKLRFKKRSYFGTELFYSQIRGKENFELKFIDGQGNLAESKGTLYKSISYLVIPLYYGIQFQKLSVNFGAQLSYAIISNGKEKGTIIYDGNVTAFNSNFGKLNIDKYDFGTRLGFIYNIIPSLAIEGTYYYGINNILSNKNAPNWNWRIQQITIGLRYCLFTKDKNTEVK